MKRINLNNYEAFWLDYLEGTLSSEDVAEFILFVSQHPELEIDLGEELILLEDTTNNGLTPNEKERLKEKAELEGLVILELDGELDSLKRLNELKDKHPQTYTELAHDYKKVILSDNQVGLSNKKDLRKPMVIPMYWRVAAAAVVGIIAIFLPWGTFENATTIVEETTPVNLTPSSPLQQISALHLVPSKSFDFEHSVYENQSENMTPEQNYAVVNETPTDTSTTEQPNSLTPVDQSEDINLVIDSATQDPEIELNDQITFEQDSVISTPIIEDDNDLATNSTNAKNLSVPEFLAEKVLNVEKQDEEPLIASILDQKTNLDVDYQASESNKKKTTQFKVGKFEFYRSSKK